MRQRQNCTLLSALTVFSQGQPDYIGLKVEDPFKIGGMEVDKVKA